MRSYTFSTVETIINQAVAEALGSSASALTALQTSSLIRQTDSINRQFINKFQRTQLGYAPWMYNYDGQLFNSIAETTLSSSVAVGATTVPLTSATGFDSAGRIWIRTSKNAIEFVDYSAKASNNLTVGSSEIDIPHSSAEKVGKLYPLSSDFGKAVRLKVNSIEYSYIDMSKREYYNELPAYGRFTTQGNYILLPEGVGAQDCTLWYAKAPASIYSGVTITDLAKSIDIPVDFERYIVLMLCSYIQKIRRAREDSAYSLQLANIELDNAINSSTNSISISRGIRTA